MIQAKAVNSAPNHDVIQVTAQEVRNAKNEVTDNPKEFESWNIHNVSIIIYSRIPTQRRGSLINFSIFSPFPFLAEFSWTPVY